MAMDDTHSDVRPSKFLVPINREYARQGRIGKTVTLTGENLQLAYIYLESGAEIPWHSHPQEAMVTLLQGTLEQWIGDDHFILRPGYAVWIPANVPHRAIAGSEPTIEIEAFSPVRDEYAARTPDYDFRHKTD